MSAPGLLHVGCAGWSLPRDQWPAFAPQGTHLQRYASRLTAVEINSSFYRPHQPGTYARWACSVPPGFVCSVKLPKQITHVHRLRDCAEPLALFLSQCMHLGEHLGCLLVQTPPSLACEPSVAQAFFSALRDRYAGPVVFEPRHPSWLGADALLQAWQIAQVAADPSPLSGADQPRGWPGVRYWRLHGAPRIYHSAYPRDRLVALAKDMRRAAHAGIASWCIFDNTASGAATADALTLLQLLDEQ